MKALTLAGALGLSLASAAAAQSPAPSDPAASLSQSAGGSDVFSRAADGSVARASAAAVPTFAPVAAAPGPRVGLLSGGAAGDAQAEVPLSSVSESSPDRGGTPLGGNPLAAAGAIGAGLLLGFAALLVQHSSPVAAASEASGLTEFVVDPVVDPVVASLAAPASTAAVLTAAPEASASAALSSAAPALLEEALSSPAASFARVFRPAARLAEPFVDSRMPVGTWRAISAPEQALIEGWDLSAEKALGQASLEEWLDRHPAAGVDAAGLKAKLARA